MDMAQTERLKLAECEFHSQMLKRTQYLNVNKVVNSLHLLNLYITLYLTKEKSRLGTKWVTNFQQVTLQTKTSNKCACWVIDMETNKFNKDIFIYYNDF